MRVGLNPQRDQPIADAEYMHQIILPVYIPDLEGYYEESLHILKHCLNSVIDTVHGNTLISVVNNGSCEEVSSYLDNLKEEGKIHELINTENIGKLNAIVKAIAGYNISYVTISDCDVLFCAGWQNATYEIYENFPKAGVVGLTPQFNMFSNNCTNTIFDNLLNSGCKFYRVEEPLKMWRFYSSLGWNMPEEHFYFDHILGIKKEETMACIGAGHYVATYRQELFQNLKKFFPYKLGGTTENYLDEVASKKGLWKLTTFKNYAFHMGNTWESWMAVAQTSVSNLDNPLINNNETPVSDSSLSFFFKNRLFKKLLNYSFFNKWFLKFKGLPVNLLKKYHKISY